MNTPHLSRGTGHRKAILCFEKRWEWQETRLQELQGAEDDSRYPHTTKGLEFANDVEEGVMDEGVPAYETQQGSKKFVEKVRSVSSDLELWYPFHEGGGKFACVRQSCW